MKTKKKRIENTRIIKHLNSTKQHGLNISYMLSLVFITKNKQKNQNKNKKRVPGLLDVFSL